MMISYMIREGIWYMVINEDTFERIKKGIIFGFSFFVTLIVINFVVSSVMYSHMIRQ